ncbi:hypothetical protein FB451DRAFT_1498286 [Mycena latifolia]|nr:hypothetical protein FB451DRAFT_1498286 [Mycena latifolia]
MAAVGNDSPPLRRTILGSFLGPGRPRNSSQSHRHRRRARDVPVPAERAAAVADLRSGSQSYLTSTPLVLLRPIFHIQFCVTCPFSSFISLSTLLRLLPSLFFPSSASLPLFNLSPLFPFTSSSTQAMPICPSLISALAGRACPGGRQGACSADACAASDSEH